MFIEVHKCKEKLCANAKDCLNASIVSISYFILEHFMQFLQPLENYGIFLGVKLAFSYSF